MEGGREEEEGLVIPMDGRTNGGRKATIRSGRRAATGREEDEEIVGEGGREGGEGGKFVNTVRFMHIFTHPSLPSSLPSLLT